MMSSPHRVLEEEERPGAAEGAVERVGEAGGVLGYHGLGQLQGDAGHAGQQVHVASILPALTMTTV
jgi:hypothetical protein